MSQSEKSIYNITLICTRHAPLGKCNSNELYQIIEGINPEVIFEEIPPSLVDKYYLHKSEYNLETNTINAYLETHSNVKNVPVDSENMPPESFFQNHEYMLRRVEGLVDINGYNYRNHIDIYRSQVERHGFVYLNSIYCDTCQDVINDAIANGLQEINDDKLFQSFKSWKVLNEMRENEMLQNIINYSETHTYRQAVFTVGAAHRKSIMQKIQEYEGKVNMNWSFYSC